MKKYLPKKPTPNRKMHISEGSSPPSYMNTTLSAHYKSVISPQSQTHIPKRRKKVKKQKLVDYLHPFQQQEGAHDGSYSHSSIPSRSISGAAHRSASRDRKVTFDNLSYQQLNPNSHNHFGHTSNLDHDSHFDKSTKSIRNKVSGQRLNKSKKKTKSIKSSRSFNTVKNSKKTDKKYFEDSINTSSLQSKNNQPVKFKRKAKISKAVALNTEDQIGQSENIMMSPDSFSKTKKSKKSENSIEKWIQDIVYDGKPYKRNKNDTISSSVFSSSGDSPALLFNESTQVSEARVLEQTLELQNQVDYQKQLYEEKLQEQQEKYYRKLNEKEGIIGMLNNKISHIQGNEKDDTMNKYSTHDMSKYSSKNQTEANCSKFSRNSSNNGQIEFNGHNLINSHSTYFSFVNAISQIKSDGILPLDTHTPHTKDSSINSYK